MARRGWTFLDAVKLGGAGGARAALLYAVPTADDAGVAVLTQHAERGGAEREARGEEAGVDADPGAGEEAEEMAVGEEENGAVGGEASVDDVLNAGGDLVDGLSLGRAVLPKVPAGAFGDEFGCQTAL